MTPLCQQEMSLPLPQPPPPPPPMPTAAYYVAAERRKLAAVVDNVKQALDALEQFQEKVAKEPRCQSVASFLLGNGRLQIVLYVLAKFLRFDLYMIVDRAHAPRECDLYHPFQVWFYGTAKKLRVRLATSYDDDLDSDVYLRWFEQNKEEEEPEKTDVVHGDRVDNTVEIKTLLVLVLDAFRFTPAIETAVARIQAEEEATKASSRYFVKDRSDDDSLSEHQAEIEAQLTNLRGSVFALFDCLLADPFYVRNENYLLDAFGQKCAHPSTRDMRKPFALALTAADEAAKKEREAAVRKAKEEARVERERVQRELNVKRAEEVLLKAKEAQNKPLVPTAAAKKKKTTE